MKEYSFDELIINHCAPALSGIKIANIFTYQYGSKKEVYKKAASYNKILNSRNINVSIIKDYDNKVIVYVYNKKRLEEYILNDDVFDFLELYGYEAKDVYKCIELLKYRMQNNKDFPHEIGIFLGYPLMDIYGFINNYGKNSLHTGYWKVYHNKNEAIKTFNRYNECRSFYINTFLNGKGILEIMDDYKMYIQN
ncbi:hypothetical protein Bint_0783 [Brachyspira intermedia PWS/A]|uniref:DUF3793 family protein n=1 Tax=Brachyspira intermedia (strain ATCC 51140 / PWS/A) TaxID=1045858 RepID=G0EKV4_BRAIP|nr:DUF3793 family protein [Brachyspira intermedia]AEM21412.1 hypothetical protein Bint_0783 [Brachyspira intermedia PWS/A]